MDIVVSTGFYRRGTINLRIGNHFEKFVYKFEVISITKNLNFILINLN